ncbi:MAG: hypothetical protein KGL34_09745 [Gammaproteobacteria bacterium]|nr:hypothetical protein [Gammaproteobacteria bacterium]
MDGHQIGALISAIAGAGWALAGASGFSGPRRVVAASVAVGVASTLAAATLSSRFVPTAERFDGSIYAISVAIEVVAIVVAVLVLRRMGRQGAIMPTIAVIVGAHYSGLWLATGERILLALGAALIAVGLAGFRVPVPRRSVTVGFGCALLLWAAALVTIEHGGRSRGASEPRDSTIAADLGRKAAGPL